MLRYYFAAFFLTLFAGTVVGIGVAVFNLDLMQKLFGREALVEEKSLPILSSTLQNPMIYEWWGSVEGKLVEKSDRTFVLENDGNRIVIKFKEDYTRFYDGTSPQSKELSEIELGSFWRGLVLLGRKDGIFSETGEPNGITGDIFRQIQALN